MANLPTIEGTVVAYREIAPTAAVGLTAADLKNAKNISANAVLITVVTNSIRITFDGTTPTNSVGHLIAAGDSIMVKGVDLLASLKMIDASGASETSYTTFIV